jgi:hypothetical protein
MLKNFSAKLLKHCLLSGSSVRVRIVVQEHHAACQYAPPSVLNGVP